MRVTLKTLAEVHFEGQWNQGPQMEHHLDGMRVHVLSEQAFREFHRKNDDNASRITELEQCMEAMAEADEKKAAESDAAWRYARERQQETIAALRLTAGCHKRQISNRDGQITTLKRRLMIAKNKLHNATK